MSCFHSSLALHDFFYPRATLCGGNIVTLLWFRVCVRTCERPSVCGPCEHDRDFTVACFVVRLGRHVNHDENMNPIDLGGQRSKVKVTMDIFGNKLLITIATKPLAALIKLGRHVNHGKRMNPFDFGGQRSKVKVTMDMYGNKLVNTIETRLCISISNLADMLTLVRGYPLLLWRSKVKVTKDKYDIWK